MSQANEDACPPYIVISSTMDSIAFLFLLIQATCAPDFASSKAIIFPIPCEAPVTIAILFFRLNYIVQNIFIGLNTFGRNSTVNFTI